MVAERSAQLDAALLDGELRGLLEDQLRAAAGPLPALRRWVETLAPELRLALALATIGAMQVGLGAAGAAAGAAAGLRGVGGEAPLLSALRL